LFDKHYTTVFFWCQVNSGKYFNIFFDRIDRIDRIVLGGEKIVTKGQRGEAGELEVRREKLEDRLTARGGID